MLVLKNLENFKKFIEPQLYRNRKFMMRFRFLFPLATSSVSLPEELHDKNIKPFMDQIETLYSLAFSKNNPRKTYRNDDDDAEQIGSKIRLIGCGRTRARIRSLVVQTPDQ